jgi:ferredoxin
VKNLFGCIPGLEKAQYHLKVPERADFGDMLVDLMIACKPKLAVMDAIVGMEGDGPAGGTPRQIGAILASPDSVALDVVASSMAGLEPLEVYTNKAAALRALGPSTVSEVEVVGTDWRELAPSDFDLPPRDVTARMPAWLGKRLRRWATARPYMASIGYCNRCKKCQDNCPVGAIIVGEDGPVFDDTKCIRCYCCQELCPPQAIGLTTPPIARFATRGRRI